MNSHGIACLTCDVEIENKEGLHTLEEILRLFSRHHVKGTFFFLLTMENHLLFENSDLLSYFDQHEFGLHIHWGQSESLTSFYRGLRSVSAQIVGREIVESLEYCRRLGFRPKSFRGGALSQTTPTLRLVKRYGFQVDSSVASHLDEKERFFQKHVHVPYRSWYFPSKKGYYIPASCIEDRIGILEIPVTRLIPSFRSWFPFTLEPTSPLFKLIISQWLFRSRCENPLLITPVFHTWSSASFLMKLNRMIEYILKRKLETMTLNEAYDLLAQNSHANNR